MKSKAFGCDNLNITLILICCPYIIPFITHIINTCIDQSYFPKSWKCANVIPLPKVNNPTEPTHLRSISILPALSKILEKVMEMQITAFLNANNVLPEKQSGFRRGYSCSTALSDLTDDIFKSRDNSEAMVLVLLDYSKAFDTLNYDILKSILHYIGFTNTASSLITSFLCDRKQRVSLDNKFSQPLIMLSGVPQGSILGPLLYSIYTLNVIKSLVYCKYHMYADDTQLYYSFNPSEVVHANFKINNDLCNLASASKNHLLKINPKKSAALLFCGNNIRANLLDRLMIKINDDNIEFKDSAKKFRSCY
jgi:Reverse transcriptase (RNA-dependent DNA polymerase).